MVLPIYVYGHPVLREETKDLTPDYPNLEKLFEDMWETMYKTDGIGLAAPQVGLSIRLFVIDADTLKEYYPECKDLKRCFVNAQIVEYSDDECSEDEGCLSLPGINEKVTRPKTITIEYQDQNFEHHRETFSGFAARVVQHEYDHIEQKMFIDHISTIRKKLIRPKLMNIAKGKVRAAYRTITAPKKK